MPTKYPTPDPSSLKKLGIFNVLRAKKARVSQPTLSRWVKNGIIQRIGRGLYLHPDARVDAETIDFVVACEKFGPTAAIGGMTALFHYGLIEQVPTQIWVMTPPERINHDSRYRCLRTKTSSQIGIMQEDHFRITSIERTLIEALKFGTKIGERIALQATRKALQEGLTTEVKLGKMATKLKLKSVLEKHWESIVP